MTARPALVLLLAASLTGCGQTLALIQLPAPEIAGKRTQPLARKLLSAKQPERFSLLTYDGTWCSVSQSRYDRTAVGESAWCAWQT